ncbi:Cof-type HAD-IIB family hydrolase [Lactobacillus intestinalis]|uniref:HAD superfamily hydrolase n=1 Tax=Lactobacillus intestinalis DSM 6629 TaxID=1423761 RepID=A0ABR5PRB3_9LACO|nr:Cof-type HAD-IIB family hydrolase [Lactobacillus intestinalis]KRM32347.1 HAD superfamily hydrolase [Lactobacillus intestinalis DSM 6629]UTW39874.1 Cof-type HAD-IIB family hydrolase [Lactobacillus intestinalis]
MIKLVACDLDGTLFNSDMIISKENANAIHQAQENGIEFLVATGRAPKESQLLLKDADIHTGFINLNGALVFDKDGNLRVKHVIDKKKAKQVIDLLHQNHFYFEIITQDNVYTENLNSRISNVAHVMVDLNPGMTFKQAVAISAGSKSIMNMSQINNFNELINNPDQEIMKIIAFDSRGHEAFKDIINNINKMRDLVVTSSSASNIEINNINAQKGIALLEYAKEKSLKREEVAAIGDNLNDESMIRNAGTGVAMGNAVPAIKELAQVETKTNNENGVAYILHKFIEDNAN